MKRIIVFRKLSRHYLVSKGIKYKFYIFQIGKAFGVESQVLSPEESKKLYPLMNVKDVYATLHSPADGTIDPASYCQAMSRGATKLGAKVH